MDLLPGVAVFQSPPLSLQTLSLATVFSFLAVVPPPSPPSSPSPLSTSNDPHPRTSS
ncbi:hypothetical protein K439DRAFT_1642794 [Ramaria rubella]|nr:hypothetical protein K439DRAFT_1642794 [Ramaria rubella]